MSKRQQRFEDEFDAFEAQGRGTRSASGRRNARDFDQAIKHMDPDALDDLIYGEEPEDDFDLRFQNRSR
ncbi:MAG: hypothetical protein AAGC46_05305 [Solirubrobacteraceae bacterium]|nr:hypothetical protein [Patulibacter sp.]